VPRKATAALVLGALAEAGRPLSASELTAATGLAPTTVLNALSALVAGGRVATGRPPGRNGNEWWPAGAAGQAPAGEAAARPPRPETPPPAADPPGGWRRGRAPGARASRVPPHHRGTTPPGRDQR
jgi:IclR helix-turn-helix domain